MNSFKLITLSLLAGLFAFNVPLYADFVCRGEVSYTWRAEKEEKDQTVAWLIIQQIGPTEDAAKEKLNKYLGAEKNKARLACKHAHESQAGCVASKYSAMSSVLESATFSGRKALESAIAADCAKGQGQCKDIVASDPQCKEQEKPVDEKAAADAKGKDSGKKDAKKK